MLLLNFKKLALASAIASTLLSGCGGGGGSGTASVAPSTILSGTAAGGAAVIGNVLVTDSLGASKGATIEANGHYSIDVSGMTGPFVLKAAGTVGNTSVTYYSAATDADKGGTVNVTPFTNLMVSNIATQMAETYFSDPANIAKIGTMITPASLAAAQTALYTKLQPVLAAMGISDSIDLLRSSFAADHSGMDAVLDLVKVEADTKTNTVTLRNALTKEIMDTDDVSRRDDDAKKVDSTKISGINTAAGTDLQAVVAKLDKFAALFATRLPTQLEIGNANVFDTSNFMMGGQTFAEFASELSTQPKAIGMKFSNVAIALDPTGPSGILSSGTLKAVISSPTSTKFDTIELKIVKVNGIWLVQGDGRIADVSIVAQAQRDEWTFPASSGMPTSSLSLMNGLWINIDPFVYNSHTSSVKAVSALVTGPGLPSGGVTMVQSVQNTWFNVGGNVGNVIPECGSQATQCVTIAQALDNSEYTVVLRDISRSPIPGAVYKVTLPKQPYVTSTLTAAMFPSVTSVMIDANPITPSTLQSAVMAGGKSVNISWTLPSGILSRNVSIWANTTMASYINVNKGLLPTATSVLIGLGTTVTTGTVTNAGVWLSGVDTYGRRLAVSKSVSIQ